MTRFNSVALAVSLALSLPNVAAAQTQVTPEVAGVAGAAADAEMNRIRADSGGSGHTVESIRQGILNQNRAFGASSVYSPTMTTNSTTSFGMPGMQGNKPFAGVQPSSTVSPYLNLFNQGPTGRSQTLDNYNLLVRPMLDQQRTNAQMQRQQQQMNMRVQQIAARPDMEAAGSGSIIPTGHQTGFGYYSHFYPGMAQARRQR